MRRYLTIRNKEVHLGLLITLIVVSMVATVYALASYVFHQTLEVFGKAIKIYPLSHHTRDYALTQTLSNPILQVRTLPSIYYILTRAHTRRVSEKRAICHYALEL